MLKTACLRLQAQKVEAFGNWAGVRVDCKKCGVTGMLYNYAKSGMVNYWAKMLQAQLRGVTIRGESVPFYHPHNQTIHILELIAHQP